MNKYLETLRKIKENKWCSSWKPQLEKIEQFVEGKITPQELLDGADDTMKGIIYYTINKIINYEEKEIKYFIKLPQDMYFNIIGAKCILVGKTKGVDIRYNDMETVGPNYMKKWSSFHDNHYIEIEGDFKKFPKGVMLYNSDWYKIIYKYPYIVERMVNLTINDYEFADRNKDMPIEKIRENVVKQLEENASRPQDGEPNYLWSGKEEAEYLPQEVIDSIKFVIPTEYLTKDEVLNGTFGTFEEILMSQDINYNSLSDKNTEERYEKLLLLFEKLDLDVDEIVRRLKNINDILAGASLEMLAIRLGKDELREKIKAAKEIVKQRRISAFKDYVNCGRPESFFMFHELSNHDRLVFQKELENLEIGVDVLDEEEKNMYLDTIEKFIIKDASEIKSEGTNLNKK